MPLARVDADDIGPIPAAQAGGGICANRHHMWTASSSYTAAGGKLYAYNRTTGARDDTKDIDVTGYSAAKGTSGFLFYWNMHKKILHYVDGVGITVYDIPGETRPWDFPYTRQWDKPPVLYPGAINDVFVPKAGYVVHVPNHPATYREPMLILPSPTGGATLTDFGATGFPYFMPTEGSTLTQATSGGGGGVWGPFNVGGSYTNPVTPTSRGPFGWGDGLLNVMVTPIAAGGVRIRLAPNIYITRVRGSGGLNIRYSSRSTDSAVRSDYGVPLGSIGEVSSYSSITSTSYLLAVFGTGSLLEDASRMTVCKLSTSDGRIYFYTPGNRMIRAYSHAGLYAAYGNPRVAPVGTPAFTVSPANINRVAVQRGSVMIVNRALGSISSGRWTVQQIGDDWHSTGVAGSHSVLVPDRSGTLTVRDYTDSLAP